MDMDICEWLKNYGGITVDDVSEIEELFLHDCELEFIPESIAKLENLKHLILTNNNLTNFGIPNTIDKLVNLEGLSLDFNHLNSFSQSILNLPKLTSLNLYCNELQSIPDEIWKLTHLTSISLGKNYISNLPESIGKLNMLNCLEINENNLTELPQSINNLTQLSCLNIAMNNFQKLPDLLSLPNLSFFKLSYKDKFLFSLENPLKDRLIIKNDKKCLKEVIFQDESFVKPDYRNNTNIFIIDKQNYYFITRCRLRNNTFITSTNKKIKRQWDSNNDFKFV